MNKLARPCIHQFMDNTRVVDASLLALVNKNVSIDLGSIDVHGGLFMGMTTKVVACWLTNQGNME